jgi:hypothetical protein
LSDREGSVNAYDVAIGPLSLLVDDFDFFLRDVSGRGRFRLTRLSERHRWTHNNDNRQSSQ